MNGRSLLFSMDMHMIEWYDRFNVNISIIDKQHKKLFDIIDKTIKEESFNNNPNSALKILQHLIWSLEGNISFVTLLMIQSG